MSSYIKKLKNPMTGKEQKALCIDDFFGQHRYGYFFLTSGEDATWDHFYDPEIGTRKWAEKFSVFNEEEVGL